MSRARFTLPMRRRQRGIGMIEILITMLVISLAFLGIVALQARALSTSNSSVARTAATLSSYSILDAMRADKANAAGGAYNMTVTANDCPAAGGTLANNQLSAWCEQLGAALGVAATTTGTIACTSTSADPANPSADCTVTVQFDDSRAGDGSSSAQQFITSAGL